MEASTVPPVGLGTLKFPPCLTPKRNQGRPCRGLPATRPRAAPAPPQGAAPWAPPRHCPEVRAGRHAVRVAGEARPGERQNAREGTAESLGFRANGTQRTSRADGRLLGNCLGKDSEGKGDERSLRAGGQLLGVVTWPQPHFLLCDQPVRFLV